MIKKVLFTALIFSFFACSAQNEEQLMETAKKHIDNKEYNEALRVFEQIVSKFPDGKNTGLAHFEIGKLYQGNVIDGVGKEETMHKAIEHYKIVYEKYPDMSEAPQALFMVGFIQANELNRLEEARESYN